MSDGFLSVGNRQKLSINNGFLVLPTDCCVGKALLQTNHNLDNKPFFHTLKLENYHELSWVKALKLSFLKSLLFKLSLLKKSV